MPPICPGFLRRHLRLHEARRALLRGDAEAALERLRDPCLALSRRADELRVRALDAVFRLAARRSSEGRDASALRLLDAASLEDPERAARWRELSLGHAPPGLATASRGGAIASGGRASTRIQSALTELCERLRDGGADGGAAGSGDGAAGARRSDPPSAAGAEPTADSAELPDAGPSGEEQRAEGPPCRFHLAVDDGGEFLVVSGTELAIGHARSGLADLPFLADLEAVHAVLVRGESFHGGPTWSIEPVGRGTVIVNGRALDAERLSLLDGDEVRLSNNLAFRFRTPEPASSSSLIELLHGAECEGAVRAILFGPGAAGRVRMGGSRGRHVPVADLEQDVELVLDGPRLLVRCAGGVRLLAPGATAAPAPEVALPCPPARRFDLLIGARPSDRPPFGCSIRPVDDLEPGGGR